MRVEVAPTAPTKPAPARRLFMVLSPRSLPYASLALESLFRHVQEPIHLSLITDSEADKDPLVAAIAPHQSSGEHSWEILSHEDLRDREADIFGGFPHLREFRNGHPCWRKITDPLLISRSGEEMVLLDPDLYFPNPFSFEPTPEHTLLLMWQKPNCLFPPNVVETALDQNIRLAHHVDIGVGQWRAGVDLGWLDWLIGRLGGAALPKLMHIEAIVWAAVAMRIGGGYLDPKHWHCWHRSQYKRVLRKVGVPGHFILQSEPFSQMKCFHAGGEAKFWLARAQQIGWMDSKRHLDQLTPISPFIELTASSFRREQQFKTWLRRSGYYRIFQTS